MKVSLDIEYIVKRIVVIVLAFVIISSIKSCNVFAISYYTDSPEGSNFTSVRIRNDGTNKNGTFASGGDNSILTYGWTWSNLTIVNTSSNTFRFNFGNNYALFNRYDNFVFNIYTKNLLISGPISTYGFNGYCELTGISSNPVDSYEVPSTSYPREVYGLYGYNVVCHHDKKSVGASRFDIPIQLLNYSEQAIFFSYYWTFYNNDNSTANAQAQAHADAVNTQNKIDNISNNLNDNSVSNDTNSNASSIFNIDIDTGHGLTAIITAPLSFLSHTQDTCTAKSFTIFGKSITLPCGDSLFWSRDFSSYHSIFGSGLTGSGLNTVRDNFRLFWNMLFGGAIVFHLLLKLWEQINLALDPMSDSYQSLSSAIDTGPAVRDTDGDGDFNGYIPKHSKDHYAPKHGGGM